jgi:hypothetical protein
MNIDHRVPKKNVFLAAEFENFAIAAKKPQFSKFSQFPGDETAA